MGFYRMVFRKLTDEEREGVLKDLKEAWKRKINSDF
jgi:hypothetical protein